MAFAAVVSLKLTIERLYSSINIIPQITKCAYEELNSLVPLLKRLDDESSRSVDRSVINELDAQISDAVWKLEDVLESDPDPSSAGVDQKEIDSFLKVVKKLTKKYDRVLETSLPAEEEEGEDEGDDPLHEHESTTVGLSDLSESLRNELLDETSGLKAVSLVGMAGIGKTLVATQTYHHPHIVRHFDSRLWLSVGPRKSYRNICVGIAAQIERKPRDKFKNYDFCGLRDLLENSFETRKEKKRYLFVLDDIWTTRVLFYLAQLLPDYGNGSRFLLTTRLQEVAGFFSAKIYQMPFLNNEESWNLFGQNVFATEESFHSELEKPGRKIADMCEGLPLLILAVASILRGLDKTEEFWNKVAEKKTTTFTDAYDQIYEILLPSYEYLPQRLKPCFLYMGVFPQTCEIPLSKLIDLWTVEDFLESSLHQDLEVLPVEYMKDIVSKSLAIVCKQSFKRYRRIKSCKLHCTYWYVCVTEARKNNFFHALNKLTDVVSIERPPQRLSVQNNILLGIKEVHDSMAESTSTTRSLLCTGEDHPYPVRVYLNKMLLMRVLDALAIRFYEFPNEVLKLLKLRYLTLTHNGELPSSISNLQQLQCLILRRHHNINFPTAPATCLPEEIWDMQELRHVRIMGSNLPDPSQGTKLPKLLRLYVHAKSCTEAVFRSIPHLKKLGIKIELQPDSSDTLRCLEHIGLLHLLESFKCEVVNPRLIRSKVVIPPDHLSNLPRSLKKLSLNGLGYSWKYMSLIGSLPELEVLKLRCYAFQGPEWEAKVGQFQNLKLLLLEDIDLLHWTVQDSKQMEMFGMLKTRGNKWRTNMLDHSLYYKSFPYLSHLTFRHCYKLKNIPQQIGDSIILETLEVDDCSPSVVASARQIKEKRSSLQLIINSSWNLR